MTSVLLCILLLCAITDGRIIQHFALFFGESQSGKSSVINAIFVTNVASIGTGSGISVTKDPTVYTKSFRNQTHSIYGVPYDFKLSMMDTPGMLDNRAIFSDQDILNAILYALTEIGVTQITAIFITESLSADRIQLHRNLQNLMEIFGESVMESIVVVGTKPLLGLHNHGEIRNKYVQDLCDAKNIRYLNYESTKGYQYKNQMKTLMDAIFSVKPYKMDQVQIIRQSIQDRADELMKNAPKREENVSVEKQIIQYKTVTKQETYLDQERGVVGVANGERQFLFFGPKKKTYFYGWVPVKKTRTIKEKVPYTTTEMVSQTVQIDHDPQTFINIAKNEYRERLKMRVYFKNESHDNPKMIQSHIVKVLPYDVDDKADDVYDKADECEVYPHHLMMEQDKHMDSIETKAGYNII